jgi:hypothetical protein
VIVSLASEGRIVVMMPDSVLGPLLTFVSGLRWFRHAAVAEGVDGLLVEGARELPEGKSSQATPIIVSV